MSFRDVHSRRNRAMQSKLQKVAACPAAKLQNVFAGVLIELSCFWKPRINAVAFLRGEVERGFIPVSLREV